jgi:manganese oxidase
LRLREGDQVRIDVVNRLPETTTVHWHGLILPNIMDGPAHVTQEPIENGDVYHYAFTVVQSGTYLYHSHDHIDRQQALGLYGALLIDPATPDPALNADHEYTLLIQEWLMREGLTYPAMPMDGAQPNYFTFNGKAFPATDTISMKVGETLKVRMIGSNNGFIHPIHIHGGPFQVVARDGQTLPPDGRFMADTVNIGPGQRYDVIWKALNPGKWLPEVRFRERASRTAPAPASRRDRGPGAARLKWWAPAQASMPIRQGGMFTSRAATWPRDSF